MDKAVDAEAGSEPPLSVFSWDDSREERNPKNWSLPVKLFHTAIACLLAFMITFATAIMNPATPAIVKEFGVSRVEATLTLTLYTLGLAIGPVFIAPLSEVYGRKPVYVVCTAIFLVFSGGAAAADNFGTLLVCRLLAGLLGSASVAIGGGAISDVWVVEKAVPGSLVFILGPFLGPALAPLVGAYILHDHNNNWRWTLYILIMVCSPVWLGSLVMRETNKVWILREEIRAARNTPEESVLRILKKATTKPVQMLLSDSIVFFFALYTAYAYAMVFSYFSSSAYILPKYYGFNPRESGLAILSVVVGYFLAVLMFLIFTKTLYMAAARRAPDGRPAPEHRLYTAMAGSVLLPAALFWAAWSAEENGNWAVHIASGIFLGIGSLSLFLCAIVYMVDIYRSEAAASALAANGMLRYILSAVFPLFTVQMYDNLGPHHAGTVFACLSILLLPIPWVLFKFGPQLRQRSKFTQKQNETVPTTGNMNGV